MDKSECKSIVEANIRRMMNNLGPVRSWDVTVHYTSIEDEATKARVIVNNDYEWATINVDFDKHETENEVLKTLRHELIHLLLAPFETYRSFVTSNIDEDTAMDHAEDRMAAHMIERLVMNIERMLDWNLDEQMTEKTPEALTNSKEVAENAEAK